jgi:hypothetical protein
MIWRSKNLGSNSEPSAITPQHSRYTNYNTVALGLRGILDAILLQPKNKLRGSKSDVAMNAWPPQASYSCGNFSDTPCWKLSKLVTISKENKHCRQELTRTITHKVSDTEQVRVL